MNKLKYLLPMLLCFLFVGCQDDCSTVWFAGRILINDEPVVMKMLSSSEEIERPCVVVDWKTSDGSSIECGPSFDPDEKEFSCFGIDRKTKGVKLFDDSKFTFTYYEKEQNAEPKTVVIDQYKWSNLKERFVTIDFTNKTFSFGKSTE